MHTGATGVRECEWSIKPSLITFGKAVQLIKDDSTNTHTISLKSAIRMNFMSFAQFGKPLVIRVQSPCCLRDRLRISNMMGSKPRKLFSEGNGVLRWNKLDCCD